MARKRNAGRTPLSRRPTRQSYSEPGRYSARSRRTTRVVVPMLEDLAALVRPEHLESVRRQVRSGERVAVYAAVDSKDRGRCLIIGPDRAFTTAPRSLDHRWILRGEVEISEDGERALPIGRAA